MSKHPLCLCHNDLFIQNLLYTENGKILIIDFEYSAFNFMGTDLVNFLVESCISYEQPLFTMKQFEMKRFPSKKRLQQLINSYADNMQADQQLRTTLLANAPRLAV